MKLIDLIPKILAAGLTLYFITSEAYYITNISDTSFSEMFFYDPDLFIITILKAFLIFMALPLFYLFKLLNYFGVLSSRGTKGLPTENEFLQTKIFYWTIYVIIFILIVLRLIGQTFNL